MTRFIGVHQTGQTAALLLAVVVASLAGAVGGYWRGNLDGKASQQAKQDRQTVQDLTGIIGSHTTLIQQANDASTVMRQATARRQAADRKSTEEFRHALAATADSRADCAFPADILRQLQAARDRAADAAAGGIRGQVPKSSAGAGW